jgi:hypothetical protein
VLIKSFWSHVQVEINVNTSIQIPQQRTRQQLLFTMFIDKTVYLLYKINKQVNFQTMKLEASNLKANKLLLTDNKSLVHSGVKRTRMSGTQSQEA